MTDGWVFEVVAGPDPTYPPPEPLGLSLHPPSEAAQMRKQPPEMTSFIKRGRLCISPGWGMLRSVRLNMAKVEPIAQTNASRHYCPMPGFVLRHPIALAVAFLPACGSSGMPARSAPPTNESEGPSTEAMATQEVHTQESEEPLGPHPLADERAADPSRSLPELTYSHLGMHIGGESNSAESKKPWLADIEKGDTALLNCYKLVDQPEKGGSYGVDLYVDKAGGSPEVRGSRQKLGDDNFDTCMKASFRSLSFHKPERPTVFSYSIHFKLE